MPLDEEPEKTAYLMQADVVTMIRSREGELMTPALMIQPRFLSSMLLDVFRDISFILLSCVITQLGSPVGFSGHQYKGCNESLPP